MGQVVIRAPDKLDDFIFSFPFLKKLEREFEGEVLHILTPEYLADYAQFLPLKHGHFHYFDASMGVMGLHRFIVNLTEVFDVQYYFDLAGDFKSAFLGLNLKSRRRVGPSGKWFGILNTVSVGKGLSGFQDQNVMNYFDRGLGKKDDNFFIRFRPKKKRYINKDSPLAEGTYDLEFLVHFADENIKFVKDLLVLFPHSRLYVFGPMPAIKEKNIIPIGEDFKELREVFIKCDGVLTDARWLMSVSIFNNKFLFPFVTSPKAIPLFRYLKGPEYYVLHDGVSILEIVNEQNRKNIVVNDEVVDFIRSKMIQEKIDLGPKT